jgi:hypothetical protein
MAPIYSLLKHGDYRDKDTITIESKKERTNRYRKYVEDRVITKKLIQLNILDWKNNKNINWNKPELILLETDIEKIKSIVFQGKRSHDDDYFDSQYKEGKLPNFLQINIFLREV